MNEQNTPSVQVVLRSEYLDSHSTLGRTIIVKVVLIVFANESTPKIFKVKLYSELVAGGVPVKVKFS